MSDPLQLRILSPEARPWLILLIVLVAGYVVGMWLNRRRSMALGRWLATGIGVLGGQIQWKWIGTMSSGAQVSIVGAARPFRQAEILYLLLTRELLPLWGIELLRGKRDLLVLRAELSPKPAREFEVVPMRGSLRTSLDRNAVGIPWQWQEMPAGLGLATRGRVDTQSVAAVREFLDTYGGYIDHLSLRAGNPHVIVVARLTGLEATPAKELLTAVRQVIATTMAGNRGASSGDGAEPA